MKCNSDYHADICPARRRNGDCVSEYPCRHKVEPLKPTSNADQIRAMSDEELGLFLGEWAENTKAWKCDGTGEVLYWLKLPYKEDA